MEQERASPRVGAALLARASVGGAEGGLELGVLEEVEEEGAEVAVELDHAAPRRAVVVDPLRKRAAVAHVPPAAVLALLARHRVLEHEPLRGRPAD